MILTLLALAAVQPPARPAAAPVCPVRAVYPAELTAWPHAWPAGSGFAIGRAVDIPVVPVANVRLAVQPSKPLTGGYLATASFEVASAGAYRIAVGGAKTKTQLWLDVAGADRRPLTSTSHGHGAECTSITKVVEFDLKPGRYTLLVTGLDSAAQPIRALIVAKR